jgi:hypothetical protein
MPEDLAALKAGVVIYEKELQQLLAEMKTTGENIQKAPPVDDPQTRDMAGAIGFVAVMQLVTRRLDLMEKYEAALRDYARALEARQKSLEKENKRLEQENGDFRDNLVQRR